MYNENNFLEREFEYILAVLVPLSISLDSSLSHFAFQFIDSTSNRYLDLKSPETGLPHPSLKIHHKAIICQAQLIHISILHMFILSHTSISYNSSLAKVTNWSMLVPEA
jgi:hypothetical protein